MVPLNRDAVIPVLRAECATLAGVLRRAPALDPAVPGLQWTVGQVAMHLFSVYGVFAAALRGEDVSSLFTAIGVHDTLPEQVAATNADVVGRFAFASPIEAAEQIADAGDALLTVIGEADLTRTYAAPWYGPHVTRTGETLVSLIGSETLMHGRDICKGLGVPCKPNRRLAALITPTMMSQMLPLVVDRQAAAGLRAVFEVRLRGAGAFAMSFADGAATAGEPGAFGRADCVLSLTPWAALLTGFGRAPVSRAIVTGRAFAYGRRPWLAATYPKLFLKP
jgi:hypothetical protein